MHVVIIGAGAAGMMCAATLAESNLSGSISLIERNATLGKKVTISGGGRCNVTTGIHDVKEVLQKYPRGSKFLTTAMYAFPPQSTYAWFEAHDVPLKTQTDQRVFPVSDNGEDVVAVFDHIFAHSAVQVRSKESVTRVVKIGKGFSIFLKSSPTPIHADILVLATGGQAYRHTGSVGDGYAFAASLGHSVTKLAPSLNAFFTNESWPATVSGLSFQNATITTLREKKYTFTGPMLFTHKGISGPAVFALSSLVAFEDYSKENPLNITVDILPDYSLDNLRGKLTILVAQNPKKQFDNVLGQLIPKSLADVVIRELQLAPEKNANEIAKKDVNKIVSWLKAIPLSVVQRGAGDEFVTAGGIPLNEINPKTMESLITPGLYFAGEIMDVDGFTGGFNLQASWAAGRLAGESISAPALLMSSE